MLNLIVTFLIAAVTSLGVNVFHSPNIWDKIPATFGSTNYPSSLDVLVNPAGTDSVSTVSHSAQHANANDAIEALEAKVGTGASTAVANSIFVGNGAGTSLFSTHATATNIWLSGLLTSGNLLSTGSSTIVGSLNITGNSTTTNATTTRLAITSVATTTSIFGAGLQSCGSQILSWSNGLFGCTALPASSAVPDISLATSSNTAYLASTTVMAAGQKITWQANCSRGGGNSQLTSRYKLANEAASTTILQHGGANDGNTSIYGFFVATTTVTITVEMVETNACDQGAMLLTTLYK